MRDTRSKSANRQGIKQTSSASSSASTSMGKSGPICWNCGEAGHLKHNCPNPPYCSKCNQKGHLPVKFPLKGKRKETSQTPQKVQQTSVDQRFSNIRNKCIHCRGDHAPGVCPMRMQSQATPSTAGYPVYNGSTSAGKTNNNASLSFSSKNDQSAAASTTLISLVNNLTGAQGHASCTQEPQITPQTMAITMEIMNALERMTTQFADTLQQTIQMGVDAQAQENKNARMDKQFEKVKVFDGSKPSECHPWLEEVHTLCIQTGRPFSEMLLLCAGQAVCDFITDMSPEAMDDQIKNDLITGYSDLQGLGCKQAAYNNIMQRPDEPLRSYIVRYSRLFKLLNGTAPNDVKMRTMSMHFVNSLCNYLSSKVENRLLGMNERNYSLGDTFKVALECKLKAIASER